MFEQKARTILTSTSGIRLRAAGCRLIDVTWLSAQLARNVGADFDCPWWTQLAERDRDVLRVSPDQPRA